MIHYHPIISSFGRRRGRPLTAYQQTLEDELLPQLQIALPAEQATLDLAQLFPIKPQVIHLEIGFGGGEHLAAQAAANPQIGYIGCEPYMNGVAKLLAEIDQKKLTNIRLFTDDARLLMARLPEASVAAIYILFPDPWPKLRHHKRRLVTAELLAELARLQPAGGRLLLATDHVDYGAWMLEHLQASPHYEWQANRKADWQTPPADWVHTRYERKTSEQGRAPMFLECRKT